MGSDNRLSVFRLLAFSGPALVIGATGIPLGVYLPAYYAGHLGVDLGIVGVAFALVQIIAIGFDPVVGLGLDATRTRWGRFRPWMLASVPVLMISTVAVFMARPGIGPVYTVGWQALMYFGLSMSMMSTNAWGSVLARDYHERSRLYAWVQVLGYVGALVCLLMPALLDLLGSGDEVSVVHAMGAFVILIAPLSSLLAVTAVGEPLAAGPAREHIRWREYLALARQPAMMRMLAANLLLTSAPSLTGALYFFFFHQARGYSFQEATLLLLIYIAAGLFMPLWARIAKILGKHRAVMAAAFVNAAGQCVLLLLPHHVFWSMALVMFVVGFAANSYALLLNAMVADVSDEVRLKTGEDRTAPLFALMIVFAKIGAAVPLAVTFPILKSVGFNPAPGAVNTASAIHGLESCFVIAPVLAIALGGACLFGYHLSAARHAQIREELDAFDARMLAAGPSPIRIDAAP